MSRILERPVTDDTALATPAAGTPPPPAVVGGQPVGILRRLEGRRVSIALKDGTRLHGCTLVSAGRSRTRSMWLVVDGADAFVVLDDVIDVSDAGAEQRPAV